MRRMSPEDRRERDRLLSAMRPGKWYNAAELRVQFGWTPAEFQRYAKSLHATGLLATRHPVSKSHTATVEWALV